MKKSESRQGVFAAVVAAAGFACAVAA